MNNIQIFQSPNNWEIITSISTALMAIAIVVTAIIASKTLLKDRIEQKMDLGIKLKNIWITDNFYEDFKYLAKNADNILNKDGKSTISEIEKTKIKLKLTKLFDYYGQISFYLNNGKLTFEVLKVNFSQIFYIHNLKSAITLYEMLKGYESLFFPDIYSELLNEGIMILSQIDGLFYKIAQYQNNKELIKLVEQKIGKFYKK